MGEIVKYINQQKSNWDTDFLVKAQEEQEKEIEQLLKAAEVQQAVVEENNPLSNPRTS